MAQITTKIFKSFNSIPSMHFFFTGILLTLFIAGMETGMTHEEFRLKRDLLENYVPVSPASVYPRSLVLTFGVSLINIIDVDFENGILVTSGLLNQNWTDNRLKWNVSEYSGISSIRFQVPYIPDNLRFTTDSIWKPDMIIYNSPDGEYDPMKPADRHDQEFISTDINVSYTGQVLMQNYAILRSTCDFHNFPFDWLTCYVQWGSRTLDAVHMDLKEQNEEDDAHNNYKDGDFDGDLSNYKPDNKFHLWSYRASKDVEFIRNEPYPSITYTITLRKVRNYCFFSVIGLAIFIGWISWDSLMSSATIILRYTLYKNANKKD